MLCELCGVEAPTKKATFLRLIGVLVVMFHSQVSGHMCKSCVHRTFLSNSGITLLFGWWGLISFFLTPVVLLINTIIYLLCLPMPGVPHGAQVPVLTEEAAEKMFPFIEELFQQMQAGEDFRAIADRIALRAGVSPGQVALFAQSLIRSAQEQPAAR